MFPVLRLMLGMAILTAGALGGVPAAQAQATLTISPQATVIGVDGTNRFLAVYDPDGPGPALPQYLAPSAVTWQTSDLGVVAVDETGLGFGRGAGEAVVRASYGDLTANAAVTVSGAQLEFTLTFGGLERTYLLYVPESYAGAQTPLVLSFHGGGGTPAAQMHTSQMNRVAHAQGFLVAYPEGTDDGDGHRNWNAGSCCGTAPARHVDDVGFTRAVLDDIESRYNVNARRVFATGLSNGAIFVHRLGHELADRIAAIAPVAGGFNPGGDFTPVKASRQVSLMEFHGVTDMLYPYKGLTDPAAEQQYTSIPKTLVYWLFRNRIPLKSKTTSYTKGIVSCLTFMTSSAEATLCTANPPAKIEMDGVLYDGGGHAWPGGVKVDTPWADIPTQDIDASAAMWTFFKRHPMP